jgi:Creatinine amidohydrolase
MLDALSTSSAIAAARPTVAVLPIGSIEQHSRHLPLGTDWIAATALSHRVAAELGACLLPALPVSMGRCHKPMRTVLVAVVVPWNTRTMSPGARPAWPSTLRMPVTKPPRRSRGSSPPSCARCRYRRR